MNTEVPFQPLRNWEAWREMLELGSVPEFIFKNFSIIFLSFPFLSLILSNIQMEPNHFSNFNKKKSSTTPQPNQSNQKASNISIVYK